MAERATVFETLQLGVESTAGTLVGADRGIQSLQLSPSIQNESDVFLPAGYKYPTVVAQNQEHTTAGVEGQPTYDELIYPFSSILTAATVTQPDATNDPNTYLWTFDPATSQADSPQTYTIEQGSPTRAHRYGYGLFTELTLESQRSGIALGGSFLAQRLEDDITLTTISKTLPLVPVLSNQIDVYMDSASADLGTTKLARAFVANFSLSDRFGPVWVLDSAEDAWAAHVETEPEGTLALTLETDAEGMGVLPLIRSGDTRFLRVEATGATIDTNYTYRLTLDLAAKVTDVGDFSDQDGVHVLEWTFRIAHDADWGRAAKVELVNTQSGL